MDSDKTAQPSAPRRNWEVLLIGGASGVGKTSLSYRLAHYFQVGITEVDDFQVILEKITAPEQQPLLHYWHTHREEFVQWSQEDQLSHFIRVSQEVYSPALEAVIANHLESHTPVILEGDFILPALAVLQSYGKIEAAGRVHGLFVYEEDEAQISHNFFLREGREQRGRAHASWLFSEWLREECNRLAIPTLAVRPWETGFDRAVKLLNS